ncbi:MAG TPA: ATP-binding protein [Longimicrobium sp.]|nr:ATP-binding protein [Longimicrobium sp.]
MGRWPLSLRTAACMMLASGFPNIVLWGRELVQIYNDGYIPIAGAKHPWALGRPTREVWPEVWHLNEPLFAAALRGETAFVVDAPYTLRRGGPDAPAEDTFFTLSFSPIRDDAGAVAGVLVTAIETTRDVKARRLQAEREQLFGELELERSRLAFVFRHAPSFLAVLRGSEHRFALVNDAYYQLVGHRDILAKPVLEAMPEVGGQGFMELLDGVLRTGEAFIGREMPVLLARTPGAEPEERFVDLSYIPLLDAGGAREGIIAHGSDVTDHVRARQRIEALLQEARAAREEAEEANRAKSEFLATMSHELRTPINAVMGYTDLLDIGIGGPVTSAQREHLGRIRASSVHLLGLIEDVLDMAKIEAGRMEVAREPSQAHGAITAALTLVEPAATAGGLTLANRCSGETDLPYVGDEDRVRQILANLLSNAVKFTPPGGRVTVGCAVTCEPGAGAYPQADGPWICLHVEDTGMGIEPGQLDAMFRPFVQAESGHARPHGGTGLGLSISRELARLMGGDLTARSAPGQGSCFTLWLPTPGPSEAPHSGLPLSPSLSAVGKELQAEVDVVVEAYRERLRNDAQIPRAAGLEDVELEDHASSFLADIAQSLVILGETGGQPDLLRDGSDLQRLISERHGAQRARVGWTADALGREFTVLREEVEAAVRRGSVPDPEPALAVLESLLERACEISVRGLRLSATAEPATGRRGG